MAYKTFEGWRYEVDRLFRIRTGCDWNKLSGEDELLHTAYDSGKTPVNFVREYASKHGIPTCR